MKHLLIFISLAGVLFILFPSQEKSCEFNSVKWLRSNEKQSCMIYTLIHNKEQYIGISREEAIKIFGGDTQDGDQYDFYFNNGRLSLFFEADTLEDILQMD